MKTNSLKITYQNPKIKFAVLFLPFYFCVFTFCIFAQDDLPGEIRGYKVYRAKISVKNNSENGDQIDDKKKDSEAMVKLGDPQPKQVSLSGVVFDISAEISAIEQSGKIDFLTFKDFRVNDNPVEIDEYRESFELSKNKTIRLPKPVKVTVSYRHTLFGILEEQTDSKEFWQVTGRIFVFGQFKKGFFKFKRVIPVDINLQIKNPARKLPIINRQ